MSEKKKRRLLIVGWDAADWKIINPLLDSGQMPALEKLVNGGVIGNINTLEPALSPMLWTSIATGKTADKHGILNFVEPHPEKAEIRPVTSTSRKVKAFWNILNQSGYKCNIVSWWPSNPAEPINGAMVSNLYYKSTGKLSEEWPLKPGTVHPASLSDIMTQARIHPAEITKDLILPFIPDLEEILAEKDRKEKLPEQLARLLAECATVHNAATWLMENTEWDVTAIYYDAIDLTCHNFMRFHPPQLPGIPDEYFKRYQHVVNGMYRFHDMMLDRLLQLAGEDTTVMILSDHGFHSDHLRPKTLPKESDAPVLEHRSFGVFGIKGPGIKKDERVYGATLLDITPTLLTLFDLPVGKDMDGKVLASVFENQVQPAFIDTWETVDGDTGMHPGEIQEDPIAAREALNQLVELGYIEAPEADMAKTIQQTINLSNFNLARVLLNRRKFTEALPILEKLHRENPHIPRYGFAYASCLHKLLRMEECREVIHNLKQVGKRAFPQLDLLEASLLLSERKPHEALQILGKAETYLSHMPGLYLQLGTIYNSILRWPDAIRTFSRALEIDPENATALSGRGLAYLRTNQIEEALEDLLDSIGLIYHTPETHFYLGEALYRYEDYEKSVQAFEVCISIEPGFRRAYAWLVKIYTEKINDPEKATHYKRYMDQHMSNTVTIVSGLPRSGTSMAMQMLHAGGINILTDHLRKEDNNNPKGYFEFEPIKKLATDNTCLDAAADKAVKVVTQLVQYLPPKFRYKIIYMQREPAEVFVSQQTMLNKNTSQLNISMLSAFEKQEEKCIAWMKAQPHIEVLYIEYKTAIQSPRETAEKMASFLGQELDIDAMQKAVDGSLYRNRSEKMAGKIG